MDQGFLALPEFDLDTMVARSIALLQEYEPKDRPYYGCFSGGKDSVVIKELARMAGVNVEWRYKMTTIDPPELVRFIRDAHPDVLWERPRKGNFFVRLETARGIPTRTQRWCCEEFKEVSTPPGSTLILGVRAEESAARSKRWKHMTRNTKRDTWAACPIVDWRSGHVWGFILREGLPYCSLYDEGFMRLGCVGCPMARAGRRKQFARWPGFERRWRLAFKRLWGLRAGTKQRDGREWYGSARFNSWEGLWEWWMSDSSIHHEDECQFSLDLWA